MLHYGARFKNQAFRKKLSRSILMLPIKKKFVKKIRSPSDQAGSLLRMTPTKSEKQGLLRLVDFRMKERVTPKFSGRVSLTCSSARGVLRKLGRPIHLPEVLHFHDPQTVDALELVSIRLHLRFFPTIIPS